MSERIVLRAGLERHPHRLRTLPNRNNRKLIEAVQEAQRRGRSHLVLDEEPVLGPHGHNSLGRLGRLGRHLCNPLKEEPKPALPVTIISHFLKSGVVLRVTALEVVA